MTQRLIVTATRHATWAERDAAEDALDWAADVFDFDPDSPIELVHGDGSGKPGGDRLLAAIAKDWGWDVIAVPADWAACGEGCPRNPHLKQGATGPFCPYAGPRRNRHMVATYGPGAAGMLALPELDETGDVWGVSGSWHCSRVAANFGLEVITRALKVAPRQPALLDRPRRAA